MRTAIPAIVGLLCFVSLPVRAVAQSSSTSSPLHVSLRPQTNFMYKAPQAATGLPNDANTHHPLPSNIPNALNVLKNWTTESDPRVDVHRQVVTPPGTLRAQALPPDTPCAHILIHYPKSLDSNAVVITPNSSADRMPVARGLPFCREDVR